MNDDQPKPPWWPTDGEEPDPRWSLANERTLLAYTRTALAFLVAGLAIAASHTAADTPAWLAAAGLPLMAAAGLIANAGRDRFIEAQRALRSGEPLTAPRAASLISRGLAALTVVAIVLAALQLIL